MSVFISACTVTPPVEQTQIDLQETQIDPQETQTDPQEIQIQQLLSSANWALEEDRLTTPTENNALSDFRQVLLIDPSNAFARDGINRIVEQYLAWALDHAERSNLKRARQFVSIAEEIDPQHPNIQPVVNKINDQEDRVVTVFKLDPVAVRRKTVDAQELDRIAARIAHHRAFVTIRAPDDRSGRWLYQELNSRVDFRLEATLELSNNASVSLTR